MRVGRNDPCPCGSGRKYKRCHVAEDEAKARSAAPTRLVEHAGEVFGVSGDVDPGVLDLAADHFRAKREGWGPAQQMVDFIQPVLDATDGSLDATNRAMQLGTLWWNLALLPEVKRAGALEEFLALLPADEAVRDDLRKTTKQMIVRHEAMFPELHRRHA